MWIKLNIEVVPKLSHKLIQMYMYKLGFRILSLVHSLVPAINTSNLNFISPVNYTYCNKYLVLSILGDKWKSWMIYHKNMIKKIYPSIPGNKNWPRCIILSRISINFCKLPIIYKAASQNENYKRFKDKHIWNEGAIKNDLRTIW